MSKHISFHKRSNDGISWKRTQVREDANRTFLFLFTSSSTRDYPCFDTTRKKQSFKLIEGGAQKQSIWRCLVNLVLLTFRLQKYAGCTVKYKSPLTSQAPITLRHFRAENRYRSRWSIMYWTYQSVHFKLSFRWNPSTASHKVNLESILSTVSR